MAQALKNWWKADAYRRWILIGGFVYAWFMSQGIPLWDDDFTSWFWKIKDKSIFHYLFEWISPISTQPQHWGFNERPLQILVYKFCQLISGYESWSYFLYKSIVYSGLGTMIYLWGRRLTPADRAGQMAATCAAIFFLVAPGPMAAHILHQDFAPTAELIFLSVTYVMWGWIEKTPAEWSGTPSLSNPEHKRWLLRWSMLAFATYLGYKSKADLKLIPIILASYVFLMRRKQWAFFAVPVGIMLVLAVPYGPGIFTKLPPFVPGSRGSEIGWMWQPASVSRFAEFIWAQGAFSVASFLREPTISLAGIMGPFLLIPMLVFLGWKMEAFDKVNWTRHDTPTDRARIFMLVWFGAVLVGISALPAINYTFRIRYGILTMVPVSILLSWVFGLFAENRARLPKWAVHAALAVFVIQAGINLNRSIAYRRDMGVVMVGVDQVYEKIATDFPNEKLVLMPDFRPYDYRPEAPKLFVEKQTLNSAEDVKKHELYKTYAVSWNSTLWDQFETVAHFDGCRSTTLFDRIFPCPKGEGTYLLRYIGTDPLYQKGEELRAKGDIAGARALHEQYLAKYPGSMAGHFVVGLESYQLKDWARSQQAYAALERYFPKHLGIMYNHALALAELKEYGGAIQRLQYIVNQEPANYAALINLYYTFVKDGQQRKAKNVLISMKRQFPENGEVTRLLASDAG